MKVLVDTCIWSLALRRKKQPTSNIEVVEFQELIEEVRVQLIGPIRQEILSGVKSKQQFSKLKKILSVFPDLPLASEDFELAAEYFNTLRSQQETICPYFQTIMISIIIKSIFQLHFTRQE